MVREKILRITPQALTEPELKEAIVSTAIRYASWKDGALNRMSITAFVEQEISFIAMIRELLDVLSPQPEKEVYIGGVLQK